MNIMMVSLFITATDVFIMLILSNMMGLSGPRIAVYYSYYRVVPHPMMLCYSKL